jgi:hypothetical protein
MARAGAPPGIQRDCWQPTLPIAKVNMCEPSWPRDLATLLGSLHGCDLTVAQPGAVPGTCVLLPSG